MKITNSINKYALFIAALSFILGTILLIAYLVSQSNSLISVGLIYVTIALALNTISFISVFANTLIHLKHYKENLVTLVLIILNIPITLGYITIVENHFF
ncbi:hypothetical protein [Aquimarina algicola]|uniref:Uncharacterized protein n=1 Tax=Aquimarina algicola TaxID=2589995 RepID=A0A504IZE7_9FLAO|nr:hypothetical protein [Aquimarina algicola]TPN81725.1 hypothetical protein FHK87_24305 [Aquimarina algicola]